MDQICSKSAQIRPLHRTQQLFLQLCKHERLFFILYQYSGFVSYVNLCATNSEVAKTIGKNEQVQVLILRLKVRKLKQRQQTRQNTINFNSIRLGWLLFNPLNIPVLQGEPNEQERAKEQQNQKWRIIMEGKKLHNNQLVNKKHLQKWQAGKKLDNSVEPKQKQKDKDQNIQQKMKIISQAQKILQINKQLKRRLIEESKYAQNQIQAIKNKHFAQQYLGKNYELSSPNEQLAKKPNSVYKKLGSNRKMSEKIAYQLNSEQIQFHNALSQNIKKRVVKDTWKINKEPEPYYLSLIPIPKDVVPIISEDIQNILNKVSTIKTSVSTLFGKNS